MRGSRPGRGKARHEHRGVVPELQRRGLFRTEYEGTTLRDHLGLSRPENRFFMPLAQAAE